MGRCYPMQQQKWCSPRSRGPPNPKLLRLARVPLKLLLPIQTPAASRPQDRISATLLNLPGAERSLSSILPPIVLLILVCMLLDKVLVSHDKLALCVCLLFCIYKMLLVLRTTRCVGAQPGLVSIPCSQYGISNIMICKIHLNFIIAQISMPP